MFNTTRTEYSVSKFQYRATGDERQATVFMQNKANFKNARIYICPCITNAYGNIIALELPKNKAKQSQFKPNFELKLALFSPELALFYKEIFAFAKNLKVL